MSLDKVSNLFDIDTAKSKGFINYSPGTIPFISNGFYNYGVVGYVDPFESDRVFNDLAICVSAFCEATVQKPPFLPRGNGGSGLTVLIPKEKMDYYELLYYSSAINQNLKWRYSYGRMVTKTRLSKEYIEIINEALIENKNRLNEIIPTFNKKERVYTKPSFGETKITELFDLKHGDFHSLDALDPGNLR